MTAQQLKQVHAASVKAQAKAKQENAAHDKAQQAQQQKQEPKK